MLKILCVYLFSLCNILWVMQGLGPYSTHIKRVEKEIKEMAKKVNDLCGMCPFTPYVKKHLPSWFFLICSI